MFYLGLLFARGLKMRNVNLATPNTVNWHELQKFKSLLAWFVFYQRCKKNYDVLSKSSLINYKFQNDAQWTVKK